MADTMHRELSAFGLSPDTLTPLMCFALVVLLLVKKQVIVFGSSTLQIQSECRNRSSRSFS